MTRLEDIEKANPTDIDIPKLPEPAAKTPCGRVSTITAVREAGLPTYYVWQVVGHRGTTSWNIDGRSDSYEEAVAQVRDAKRRMA